MLDLERAALEIGTKKLLTFAIVAAAGIAIPESVVLVRGSSTRESQGTWRARVASLAERGNDKLFLRCCLEEGAAPWRARFVNGEAIVLALDELVRQTPSIRCVLVQPHWTPRDCGSLVTIRQSDRDAIGSNVESGRIVGQIERKVDAIETALGVSADIVFGVESDKPVLLSLRVGADLDQAIAKSIELARANRDLTLQSIAVAADALGRGIGSFEIEEKGAQIIGKAIGNSWATGRASFSKDSQRSIEAEGDPVVVIRRILHAEDCPYFAGAAAVVSVCDGVTSHYALLAGSIGKPCLVDLTNVEFEACDAIRSEECAIKDGDWLTVDETTGSVVQGRAVATSERLDLPEELVRWAHETREHGLAVNSEDAEDIARAIAFGADGVGLCRSERFLARSPAAMAALRLVVRSSDPSERAEAIILVCGVLQDGLRQILAQSSGRPVNYRLLEPAEVLADAQQTACDAGASVLRGEAFRVSFADLVKAQIECAIAAALEVSASKSVDLTLVLPMVSDLAEFEIWAKTIREAVASLGASAGERLSVRVGMMVETPRAALGAADFACFADAFLYGTNDLTSFVWGVDRFVAFAGPPGRVNPFERFDATGVGALMSAASREARAVNPSLRLSVCGAHASVPYDVEPLIRTGVDGLSSNVHMLTPIALQLALVSGKRDSRWPPLGLPPTSAASAVFEDVRNRAMSLAHGSGRHAALAVLGDWANDISREIGAEWSGVWKFFKRDLAAHWFGAREARRFLPGWRSEHLEAYVLELAQRYDGLVRFSVFPADIACRAFSELLPSIANLKCLRDALAVLDCEQPVEVFPQQLPGRTSFRAILRACTLSVEGALGPAIDVFWKAPLPLATFGYDGIDVYFEATSSNEDFVGLFDGHLEDLHRRALSLREFLGADWISLEGYAGPQPGEPLFIADVDLPLDSALLFETAK